MKNSKMRQYSENKKISSEIDHKWIECQYNNTNFHCHCTTQSAESVDSKLIAEL